MFSVSEGSCLQVRFNGASVLIPADKAAWRDVLLPSIHIKRELACPEQEGMVQSLEKAGLKVHKLTVNSTHTRESTAFVDTAGALTIFVLRCLTCPFIICPFQHLRLSYFTNFQKLRSSRCSQACCHF